MSRTANNFEVQNASYRKGSGEVSNYNIIVMSQPSDNLSVIDVTEATPQEREQVQALLRKQRDELMTLLNEVGNGNSGKPTGKVGFKSFVRANTLIEGEDAAALEGNTSGSEASSDVAKGTKKAGKNAGENAGNVAGDNAAAIGTTGSER